MGCGNCSVVCMVLKQVKGYACTSAQQFIARYFPQKIQNNKITKKIKKCLKKTKQLVTLPQPFCVCVSPKPERGQAFNKVDLLVIQTNKNIQGVKLNAVLNLFHFITYK